MLLQPGDKNQITSPKEIVETALHNELKEAFDDIKEGKIKSFDSIDDLFKELDA